MFFPQGSWVWGDYFSIWTLNHVLAKNVHLDSLPTLSTPYRKNQQTDNTQCKMQNVMQILIKVLTFFYRKKHEGLTKNEKTIIRFAFLGETFDHN